MKNSKFLAVLFIVFATVSSSFSQGNKINMSLDFPWNEDLVPIECIGPYSGTINMSMTFFVSGRTIFDGKVLNKANGEVIASDGKEYTIKSVFNCNLFSARTSASELSVQSMTFRVRCKESEKIVATVHTTWHYDTNGVEENPFMVNSTTVCH